jgi:hypothetical protein
MIFAFYFAPLGLTKILLSIIGTYITQLTILNIQDYYTTSGYTTGNFKFIKDEAPRTYAEANAFCLSKGMEMFTTTSDMKIGELMTNFSLESIWTQMFQHGVTKSLVNVDQFAPVTIVNDTVIGLPNIVIPDKHLIVIKKKPDGTIGLEPQSVMENHGAVCIDRLLYPNTTLDRKILESFKTLTLKSLQEKYDNLQYMNKGQQLMLKNIPNLGKFKETIEQLKRYNISIEETEIRNFTLEYVTLMEDIQGLVAFSLGKWMKISNPDEFILLESNNRLLMEKINGAVLKIWNTLQNPTLMTPESKLNEIKMGDESSLAYTNSSDDLCFFVHLGGEKGINEVTFPFQKFQVIDLDWIGFFKVSFPDILFSIFFGISMFGYFAYFICEAHELYNKRKRVTQFRK